METGIVIGSVVDFENIGIEVDLEMDENSVHYNWNWMCETEHYMDMEVVVYDAQDQTDSMKDLDGSAIQNCKCWSMEVW